ncbi:ShlB/FhaC/HecB family hemolysin secretion/activation protein [Marinomonas sp.]|uniref:ShlB/FhaC/HecB family hemolysin secretion/activation protein n=1 Tax=Marinomonas sp. TaxID=1904862 RepID=UPI003BA9D626
MIHDTMKITSTSIVILTLSLLGSFSAFAASVRPDAGQTNQELQKQPTLTTPKALPSLPIENNADKKESTNNTVYIPVKTLRVEDSSVFTAAELEALVADLVDGERTLAELEAGAERITSYYRKHGYLVARAYLPAQDILDGLVTIKVIEGQLDQLRIFNTARLSDARAEHYFDNIKSGAGLQIYPIERALLLLNDTPGIGQANASLEPGSNIGTTDLLVELKPSSPFNANVKLDNFGNRYTGKNRLDAELKLNSPLKIGDQFTLRALGSDLGTTYSRIAYSIPLASNGLRLGAAYSDTHYKLGREFASLQAHGSATSRNLYITYPLIRSQTANISTTLNWENKKLIDKTDIPVSNINKQVSLSSLELSGDLRDTLGGGGVNTFALTLSRGTLTMDADSLTTDQNSAKSNGAFTHINLNTSRLQYLNDSNTLSLTLSGQLANKNLNSSEKFSLGGIYGVRAYPSGEASGDEGWLANLSLQHSFSPTLKGLIFYDAGSVTINHKPYTTDTNHRFLSGVGFGANILFLGVQLDAYAAWRGTNSKPQSEPDNTSDKPRLWVQAKKQF